MTKLTTWVLAAVIGMGFAVNLDAQTTRRPATAPPGASSPRQCGAFELTERQRLFLFWYLYNQARYSPPSAMRTSGASVAEAIPVAFHVIHDGTEGFIPQEDVEAQIEVLNQAFAPIRFALASLDYTDNPDWFNMRMLGLREWQAKRALQLNPRKFLNIYTVNTGDSLLGWAIFPYIAGFIPVLDGATVLYSTVTNGSEFAYNQGDTLVHEVGHWAGLLHTFGLGFGCSLIGDLIADTPVELSPSYDCAPNRDTCPLLPGNDPIHNFMDYSDDTCADHFTAGQYSRMNLALALFRPQLHSP